MALRWSNRGVRVNSLAPGWFPSEMTDFVLEIPPFRQRILDQTANGRLGEPKELPAALPPELAPAALLLASDAGSYITGSTLVVDGGISASVGEAPFPVELAQGLAQMVPDGLGESIMPEGVAG